MLKKRFLVRRAFLCHGGPLCPQYIVPTNTVVPFLMSLYERTNDAKWRSLADRAMEYVENELLPSYCREAQFEDTDLYYNYHNLTNFLPCALIRHYCRYYSNDARRMAIADELMRFVEDQFVVWKRPASRNNNGCDTSLWHTSAGLEQYLWYVPIGSSTAGIADTFYAMYKAGRGELHLVKALVLADWITNMQRPDSHALDELPGRRGQFPVQLYACPFRHGGSVRRTRQKHFSVM